jgi:two-component system, OmpR family, response regulator CpxR
MRPKKVILLVDHNEQELSELKFVLATHSYNVLEATSGKDAIAVFARNLRVDLVMVEGAMPVMTGAQLIARLKKTRRWIPMALLAGPGLKVDPDGVHDGVIARSIPRVDLLDRVKTMCARKRGPRKGLPRTVVAISEISTGFIHRVAPSRGKTPLKR